MPDNQSAGVATPLLVTSHFNRLSESQSERLAILIEECGEVVQAACKVLRHGYESRNPKVICSETNREGLERELGDLQHALLRMEDDGDVSFRAIDERRYYKGDQIKSYLHHQELRGSTK